MICCSFNPIVVPALRLVEDIPLEALVRILRLLDHTPRQLVEFTRNGTLVVWMTPADAAFMVQAYLIRQGVCPDGW